MSMKRDRMVLSLTDTENSEKPAHPNDEAELVVPKVHGCMCSADEGRRAWEGVAHGAKKGEGLTALDPLFPDK